MRIREPVVPCLNEMYISLRRGRRRMLAGRVNPRAAGVSGSAPAAPAPSPAAPTVQTQTPSPQSPAQISRSSREKNNLGKKHNSKVLCRV